MNTRARSPRARVPSSAAGPWRSLLALLPAFVLALALAGLAATPAPAMTAPALQVPGDGYRSIVAPEPGVPDDSASIAPNVIWLVGTAAGVADPWGKFTVIVRDNLGDPVPSVPVTVDFTQCLDTRPAAIQPYPGMVADCSTITVVTDADGAANFDIVGEVHRYRPWSTPLCATISAGGVFLRNARVTAFDLDGVDGVDLHDVVPWLCDFKQQVFGTYVPRSDHNGSGNVNAADLSLWVRVWVDEGSGETGTRCDGEPIVAPHIAAEDGGLNLAWNDCLGGGGTETATFACNTNVPTFQIHGSIVAPSTPPIDSLIGYMATLRVLGPPGTQLPAWWRFERGGCRDSSLRASGDASLECPPLFPSGAFSVGGGMYVDYPHGDSSVARVRVYGVVDPRVALEPGTEYELFSLRLMTNRTVGAEACAGCTTRVAMILESVELIEGSGCSQPNPSGPGRRVIMTAPATRSDVFWQGYIADVGDQEIPGTPMLRLAAENPGRGRITVGFLLPSALPARIEVLDVAGRRILGRQLDSPSPGPGTITFGESGELGPGLYLVRLVQAGRVATVKTVLTR